MSDKPQPQTIPVDILKDGDYVVFQGTEGFTLYHMSDGQLWRTVAPTLDKLTADIAKPVEGIYAMDGLSRVLMSGHETVEPEEDLGKVNKIESPEPEDFGEIAMELPGEGGEEGGEEVLPDDLPQPEGEPGALPPMDVEEPPPTMPDEAPPEGEVPMPDLPA